MKDISVDDEIDWTIFHSSDRQQWIVAKLWEDENDFSVIAAIIKREETGVPF